MSTAMRRTTVATAAIRRCLTRPAESTLVSRASNILHPSPSVSLLHTTAVRSSWKFWKKSEPKVESTVDGKKIIDAESVDTTAKPSSTTPTSSPSAVSSNHLGLDPYLYDLLTDPASLDKFFSALAASGKLKDDKLKFLAHQTVAAEQIMAGMPMFGGIFGKQVAGELKKIDATGALGTMPPSARSQLLDQAIVTKILKDEKMMLPILNKFIAVATEQNK